MASVKRDQIESFHGLLHTKSFAAGCFRVDKQHTPELYRTPAVAPQHLNPLPSSRQTFPERDPADLPPLGRMFATQP